MDAVKAAVREAVNMKDSEGEREPPVRVRLIIQDVKAKPAALVGTASKGMGVQKVLTHELLLCGSLGKAVRVHAS